MIVPKVGLGSFAHFLCGLVFPGVVPPDASTPDPPFGFRTRPIV